MPHSANRLVVIDAGPLMALGRHELLHVLHALFQQVHVPQLVLDECLVHLHLPDAQGIQMALTQGWLLPRDSQPLEIPGLDPGERCAIGCALGMGAALLVDDRAARRHAEALGIPVLGALGVLVLAKRRGLLAEVKAVAQAMRDQGHYISQAALDAVLQSAGEA